MRWTGKRVQLKKLEMFIFNRTNLSNITASDQIFGEKRKLKKCFISIQQNYGIPITQTYPELVNSCR